MPLLTTGLQAKWIRVNRKNPCPVCGKPDWCMIATDGKAVICARIESASTVGNKGAGWLHHLDNEFKPLLPQHKAKQTLRASRDILNETYQFLLNSLPISDYHLHNLLDRGLNIEQIKIFYYKSLPGDSRYELINKLVNAGCKTTGVPGFFIRLGRVELAGPPGLLIPVRDLKRRIVGIQIRRDHVIDNKYCWLSSSKYNQGSSPGAPVHITTCNNVSDEVWVTEGPMKADIASLVLGKMVLAVPGVSNWAGIIPIIFQLQPSRVVIAFDMDKSINNYVKYYIQAMTEYLISHNIRVFEADWDANFKGIDDFVVGQ